MAGIELSPSRLCLLKNFANVHSSEGVSEHEVWMKRDDELSFVATGNKIRKLSSLIPALIDQKIEICGLMGGWSSNSLVATVSLLKEFHIGVHCFVWGRPHPKGNSALLRHLLNEDEFTTLEEVSEQHCLTQLKTLADGRKCKLIPEGLSCPESFAGSITLGTELAISQRDPSNKFDQIFIDAGTGLSAAGLIAGLGAELGLCEVGSTPLNSILKKNSEQKKRSTKIFIVSLAEEPLALSRRIEECLSWSPQHKNIPEWTVVPPVVGKSFGSVPNSVWEFSQKFAKEHGILVDPIYTAKLLMTAQTLLSSPVFSLRSSPQRSVIIHSGGGHSLHGFL